MIGSKMSGELVRRYQSVIFTHDYHESVNENNIQKPHVSLFCSVCVLSGLGRLYHISVCVVNTPFASVCCSALTGHTGFRLIQLKSFSFCYNKILTRELFGM